MHDHPGSWCTFLLPIWLHNRGGDFQDEDENIVDIMGVGSTSSIRETNRKSSKNWKTIQRFERTIIFSTSFFRNGLEPVWSQHLFHYPPTKPIVASHLYLFDSHRHGRNQ